MCSAPRSALSEPKSTEVESAARDRTNRWLTTERRTPCSNFAKFSKHGDALGIRHGWKEDPATLFGERVSWVLYVDLPDGQVSFHGPSRGAGPAYLGEWDGQRGMSVQRVIDFCESVYKAVEEAA